MACSLPVTTGQWTLEEHDAFVAGLRTHGTNWVALQQLVPSRTLQQIRVHGERFFARHGVPLGGDAAQVPPAQLVEAGAPEQPAGAGAAASSSSSSAAASASSGAHSGHTLPHVHGEVAVRPVAHLRHVFLEPLHPRDELGIAWRLDDATGGVHVESFIPVVPSAPGSVYNALPFVAAPGAQPVVVHVPPLCALEPSHHVRPDKSVPGHDSLAWQSATATIAATGCTPGIAEESDLVMVGDVVVGVSGVCVVGMHVEGVKRVLALARAMTPAGAVALTLSDVPLGPSLVEEATWQCVGAATELLGGDGALVAAIHAGAQAAFTACSLATAVAPAPMPPDRAIAASTAAAAAAPGLAAAAAAAVTSVGAQAQARPPVAGSKAAPQRRQLPPQPQPAPPHYGRQAPPDSSGAAAQQLVMVPGPNGKPVAITQQQFLQMRMQLQMQQQQQYAQAAPAAQQQMLQQAQLQNQYMLAAFQQQQQQQQQQQLAQQLAQQQHAQAQAAHQQRQASAAAAPSDSTGQVGFPPPL